MHALINFQTALLTERLITYCTDTRVLTTMYTLMFFSDYHVHWMPYYTFHTNMEDDTCVGIHLLSDYSFDWMPYYTHTQDYKDANHYVCVDVLSDCSYH
jgi:hypothetical protein